MVTLLTSVLHTAVNAVLTVGTTTVDAVVSVVRTVTGS